MKFWIIFSFHLKNILSNSWVNLKIIMDFDFFKKSFRFVLWLLLLLPVSLLAFASEKKGPLVSWLLSVPWFVTFNSGALISLSMSIWSED